MNHGIKSFSRLQNRFRKPLKVYWWRYKYPEELNFGDEITPLIIRQLTGRRCVWAPPDSCEVAGAGSIIELLEQQSNGNPVKVWGSGFIRKGPEATASNLHFTAVRGTYSRDRTVFPDAVLGDPGLLTSIAFPVKKTKRFKVGVLPHYIDKQSRKIAKFCEDTDCALIDALAPVEEVIKKINSCDLVLSSSLHGLILSDSYCIPNYWIPVSDLVTGGDYKFNDYYSALELKPVKLSLETLKNSDIEDLINSYRKREFLEPTQKGLITSLPC